jgi:hypothetical protein
LSTENPYAPPQAIVADVAPAQPSPPLWNPNAAASWSLLFSPVFGAIVHMKNWQAMGEPEKADASRRWAIGSFVFFVVLSTSAFAFSDSRLFDMASRAGGLAVLLAWYYASAKHQSAYVLAKYGKSYPRKGWIKPLLFAVLAFVGIVVAAGVVGAILGALGGVP